MYQSIRMRDDPRLSGASDGGREPPTLLTGNPCSAVSCRKGTTGGGGMPAETTSLTITEAPQCLALKTRQSPCLRRLRGFCDAPLAKGSWQHVQPGPPCVCCCRSIPLIAVPASSRCVPASATSTPCLDAAMWVRRGSLGVLRFRCGMAPLCTKNRSLEKNFDAKEKIF